MLDATFHPAILALRLYEARVHAVGTRSRSLTLALERDQGYAVRMDCALLPKGDDDNATLRYVERLVKFLLWSAGGHTLFVAGPDDVAAALARHYSSGGARGFDVELMQRVYDRVFTVRSVHLEDVPPTRSSKARIGGHWNGCRLGFDLGASDYKVAAVRDGEVVFSDELPWTPRDRSDPAYHIGKLREGLKIAARHLPRVDAIGGSSAGIYVANRPRIASLFRAVPSDRFEAEVIPMFETLAAEWGAPLVVVNDGDVTAVAGALSLHRTAVLGLAMGSSEAAGYVDREGAVTGRLNELAFAPVDMTPDAPVDEWSGDRGVGALYFSQQAVSRVAMAVGIAFEADMPQPDRLKHVQKLMDDGDARAGRVFDTIGEYLGWSVPWYGRFYDFDALLILGRVLSGLGGERIVAMARSVLETEFPEMAGRIELVTPDERMRRVGQAVAAASLPSIETAGTGSGVR